MKIKWYNKAKQTAIIIRVGGSSFLLFINLYANIIFYLYSVHISIYKKSEDKLKIINRFKKIN